MHDWDAHPIELVSRILLFYPESLNEISDFLTRLVGTPFSQHAPFTKEWCGTHVHVRLPMPANPQTGALPPTFTLPTLQHLAYILVMYEKAIMTLFPQSRRADPTDNPLELQTNLDKFYEESPRPSITFDDSWDTLTDEEVQARIAAEKIGGSRSKRYFWRPTGRHQPHPRRNARPVPPSAATLYIKQTVSSVHHPTGQNTRELRWIPT